MIHLEMKNNPSAVACLARAGVSNVHLFYVCMDAEAAVCGCGHRISWSGAGSRVWNGLHWKIL